MEELKRRIKEIEAEIFAITGKSNKRYNHWADDEEKRNQVEELLYWRKDIIDDEFPLSSDEDQRLWSINEKLYGLTVATWQQAVAHSLSFIRHNPFRDDFVVESLLKYEYEGEDSVLKLDEDSEYGSNFALIIKVITEFCVAERQGNIFDVRYDIDDLFVGWFEHLAKDETNSSEIQFWKLKESYLNVPICYAAHYLVNRMPYSAADLIRLNNFKQKISVTHKYTHRLSADPDLGS